MASHALTPPSPVTKTDPTTGTRHHDAVEAVMYVADEISVVLNTFRVDSYAQILLANPATKPMDLDTLKAALLDTTRAKAANTPDASRAIGWACQSVDSRQSRHRKMRGMGGELPNEQQDRLNKRINTSTTNVITRRKRVIK